MLHPDCPSISAFLLLQSYRGDCTEQASRGWSCRCLGDESNHPLSVADWLHGQIIGNQPLSSWLLEMYSSTVAAAKAVVGVPNWDLLVP